MDESEQEEIKEGYLSDDANSQKTVHMMDYEKSNETIVDLTDMQMMEEEKFSANFSDPEDDIISLDEDVGNFSDHSDPDVEEVEQ